MSIATRRRSLRIAVAEDHSDMRGFFLAVLPSQGHDVVGTAANGQELVELCALTNPDLVISDIAMPVMDGLQAAERIYQDRPVAIILVSAHYDKQLIQRAQLDYIMGYLVKPIVQADLDTAIPLAMMRYEQFEKIRAEAKTARQAMIDRRIVEQAKALIMQATDLSEEDAFGRLQWMAFQQERRLSEVAQTMISSTALRRAAAKPLTDEHSA